MAILLHIRVVQSSKFHCLHIKTTHLHSHIGNNYLCKVIVYAEFQYLSRYFVQSYQNYTI